MTPDDLRPTFSKQVRGYKPADVDSFLEDVRQELLRAGVATSHAEAELQVGATHVANALFAKEWRGYDMEEVDRFLDALQTDLAERQREWAHTDPATWHGAAALPEQPASAHTHDEHAHDEHAHDLSHDHDHAHGEHDHAHGEHDHAHGEQAEVDPGWAPQPWVPEEPWVPAEPFAPEPFAPEPFAPEPFAPASLAPEPLVSPGEAPAAAVDEGHCAFCGRAGVELVVGPEAAICADCVELARQALAQAADGATP